MTYPIKLTACEARWRTRAVHLADAMPTYAGTGGAILHARTPGAAPEGLAVNLAPGDVVSFRFPYLDTRPERDGARPKRPALVVERNDTTNSVVIAYGTSRATDANAGHEIRIKHDFAACGLTRPTRFVLARRIRVSRSDARFVCRGGSPILGQLPKPLVARLGRLCGLLTELYGDEELRHVHEWIGANCREDRIRIAAALRSLHMPQRAAA